MSIPVDKDEKKKLILNAALRVFAKKGAVGTKIQDIADEANIAKGTIYLYFKNKQEIFKSIMHQNPESDPNAIMKLLKSDISPEEKLIKLTNSFISKMCENDYPTEVMPEIWAAMIRSKERKNLENMVLSFRNIITNLVKEIYKKKNNKIDHENIATSILAMIHGLVIMNAINKEKFNAEKAIKTFITNILN